MARARVPIFGKPASYVTIDTDAAGAELGVNLTYQGRVLDPREILNIYVPVTTKTVAGNTTIIQGGGGGPPSHLTTDDVIEGGNLYFTAKRAEDAVGSIFSDSTDIHFTYNSTTPAISATLKPNGVTAGSYGDASHIPQFSVDAEGRVTGVSPIAISTTSLSAVRAIAVLRAY